MILLTWFIFVYFFYFLFTLCVFFVWFQMKTKLLPKTKKLWVFSWFFHEKWYPKNESKYEYFKILQFLHLTSLRLHRQKIVLTRKYIGKLPLVWGKNPTTIEDKWFNLKQRKTQKKMSNQAYCHKNWTFVKMGWQWFP